MHTKWFGDVLGFWPSTKSPILPLLRLLPANSLSLKHRKPVKLVESLKRRARALLGILVYQEQSTVQYRFQSSFPRILTSKVQ